MVSYGSLKGLLIFSKPTSRNLHLSIQLGILFSFFNFLIHFELMQVLFHKHG